MGVKEGIGVGKICLAVMITQVSTYRGEGFP